MRHSIVIALSLLVGLCLFQPRSEAQIPPSDSTTALDGSATDAVVAERSGPRQKQAPGQTGEAASAAENSADDASITQVKVVPGEDAENTRICEFRQRPGSRMARKVCYTRAEQLANEAAREEALNDQLAELQREQRWRNEVIRDAQMRGRRPSGFGLGPN